MSLIEQINKKRRDIKTDGYPMAISEWVSMYEQGELDIHPEFQRFYRWSESQKTGLVESILLGRKLALGLPLPPQCSVCSTFIARTGVESANSS